MCSFDIDCPYIIFFYPSEKSLANMGQKFLHSGNPTRCGFYKSVAKKIVKPSAFEQTCVVLKFAIS